MHPLYERADRVSREAIGAAIEVHRNKGSGLIESIYERCILRELELSSIPFVTQRLVRVAYKGLVFDELLTLQNLCFLRYLLFCNFVDAHKRMNLTTVLFPGDRKSFSFPLFSFVSDSETCIHFMRRRTKLADRILGLGFLTSGL